MNQACTEQESTAVIRITANSAYRSRGLSGLCVKAVDVLCEVALGARKLKPVNILAA